MGSVMQSERDFNDAGSHTDKEASDHQGSMESKDQPSRTSQFLKNISSIFTFKKDESQAQSKEEAKWEEFPWEQIFIKTDIIKKWNKVDMKKIMEIH